MVTHLDSTKLPAATGAWIGRQGEKTLPNIPTLDELKEKGRPYFMEEWGKVAVDGKVEFSDILYVYIARKA